MVATNHEAVLFLIVKYESENTVNLLEKIHSLVAIERKDNFAVRTRLEIIFSLISFANLLMIVNFTVHSQHLFAVGEQTEAVCPTAGQLSTNVHGQEWRFCRNICPTSRVRDDANATTFSKLLSEATCHALRNSEYPKFHT